MLGKPRPALSARMTGWRITPSAAAAVNAAAAMAAMPPVAFARRPGAELTLLSLSSGALGPAFDPDVRHYALRCGHRDGLMLRLTAADPAARVTVNGQPVVGDGGEAFLSGLAGDADIVNWPAMTIRPGLEWLVSQRRGTPPKIINLLGGPTRMRLDQNATIRSVRHES